MVSIRGFRQLLPVAILPFFLPFLTALPHTPRNVLVRAEVTDLSLRILPLGDSITWGWQPEHQATGTNGYRQQLLNWLTGAKVNFVGTQKSGDMVDKDNEGHSGFTISQIQNAMGPGLDARPNVVLLHAGTNDLNSPETPEETWYEAPNRLGKVIDQVVEKCPDAVVIVAKIIQAENNQTAANIKAFNQAINTVAYSRVDLGYKISVVDQSVVGVAELVDGLHPTDAGYAHMGDVWFEGMKLVAKQGLVTPPV